MPMLEGNKHTMEMLTEIAQRHIVDWVNIAFPHTGMVKEERALRATEEMIEAAQSAQVTREKMHALVDQVYNKPVEPMIAKEIGASMFCLLALAQAYGINASEAMFERLEDAYKPERLHEIRQKHTTKVVADPL